MRKTINTSYKFTIYILLSFFSSSLAATPLFDAYPKLKDHIPYKALGAIEATPIIHAKSFEPNTHLYIKNDGIDGTDKNGKKIFTGNKRRKLQFLLPDAQAHNAKCVYAAGLAGSNFATATAAYAQDLGLTCTIVLGPQRNTRYAQRNLKLDLFYGANIITCQTRKERIEIYKKLEETNHDGYFIPAGGSNKIGTIGFVDAAFEFKNQIDQGIMPKPDVIYVTACTAGMAAGLIVGFKAAKLDIIVKSVRIADTTKEIQDELARLIKETSEYLHQYDESFPIVSIAPQELIVLGDLAGEKYIDLDHAQNERHKLLFSSPYALAIPEAADAIATLQSSTGIKLDGTYSGKTFAACLKDINSGELKNKTVLFWNSFCPGSFSEYTDTVDTKKLPEELQKYFDGTHPIQSLDQGV